MAQRTEPYYCGTKVKERVIEDSAYTLSLRLTVLGRYQIRDVITPKGTLLCQCIGPEDEAKLLVAILNSLMRK